MAAVVGRSPSSSVPGRYFSHKLYVCVTFSRRILHRFNHMTSEQIVVAKHLQLRRTRHTLACHSNNSHEALLSTPNRSQRAVYLTSST